MFWNFVRTATTISMREWCAIFPWSERRELNPRPQVPQTCAIPLRYAPLVLEHFGKVSDNDKLARYHYATPRRLNITRSQENFNR